MLELVDVNVFHGAIHALKGVSLEVKRGEIVSLLGANGAGKSTTLRAISGLARVRRGTIALQGDTITNLPTPAIVRRKLAHVPEGRRVFAHMSVEENLELGAFLRSPRSAVRDSLDAVYERFPRLLERRSQLAGTLSGGEQQMLAMGRALMAKPEILLLDEPSMGLAPLLVREVFRIIRTINQEGTTILLVEQNAHMALSIAHRAYVLESGRITLSGNAADLVQSDDLKKAYLGG